MQHLLFIRHIKYGMWLIIGFAFFVSEILFFPHHENGKKLRDDLRLDESIIPLLKTCVLSEQLKIVCVQRHIWYMLICINQSEQKAETLAIVIGTVSLKVWVSRIALQYMESPLQDASPLYSTNCPSNRSEPSNILCSILLAVFFLLLEKAYRIFIALLSSLFPVTFGHKRYYRKHIQKCADGDENKSDELLQDP